MYDVVGEQLATERQGERVPALLRTGVSALLAVLMSIPLYANEDLLRLGLDNRTLSNVSPVDVEVAFTVWVESLAKAMKLDVDVSAAVYKSTDELIADTQQERVDVLVINTLTFLDMREKLALEPILSIEASEGVGEVYVLLVKAKQAASLAGLRDKKVNVHVGGNGLVPMTWLDSLLAREKLPSAGQFFRKCSSVAQGTRCILPVYFEEVDAAVVEKSVFDTVVELNPQLGRELKVLARSAALLNTITCFRPNFANQKVRRIFETEVYDIDKYLEAQQIFTLYRVKQLVPYRPEYLTNIERLWRTSR